MAAEAPLQGFLEELTCSICLEYFQDPVLIPECGHNFCRGCLTRSWGTSESEASCPQCRQTFAPRSLLPNRQLARVLEEARLCGGHPGEEGGSFCPKHREPLKLFCKHHETLICIVCDRSKEHEGHSVIPAEEAFQEYQIKVEDFLKAQKEQKEKIATYKGDTEQTVQEMLNFMEKVKINTVAEFRGQEKLLLTKMEETKKDIMARKEEGLAKHMEEMGSLDHLIQEIEEKLQQPASKLLQDIGSILKKYQAKETYENPVDLLLEPKWTIWDYSDMTALLKSDMKKLRDTLESGLQLQEVNVTLNPSSDYWYEVSQDQKSAKGVDPDEDLFIYIYKYRYSSPMRFVHYPWVFGSQKFSTGRHFWEVIVGGTAGWAVGVAHLDDCGQNLFWHFVKCGRKCIAISPSESSDLVLTEEPTRIRISLNCEGGQVSFFDASTASLIHTFSDASLVGEILQPCICVDVGTCLTFS